MCQYKIFKLRNIKYEWVSIIFSLMLILFAFLIHYFGILRWLLELSYETSFQYPMLGNVLKYAHQARYGEVEVEPLNPYDHMCVYNCANKCLDPDQGPLTYVRLIILVKSAADHFNHRKAIRSTWANGNPSSIRTVFLLGETSDAAVERAIQIESRANGDIVQFNFIDDYYNNTIKTMLGFRWVVEHCTNSEYIMFADDDYYVSIRNVLRYIENPSEYPNTVSQGRVVDDVSDVKRNDDNDKETKLDLFYAGYTFNGRPFRYRLSKWYVKYEDYPFDKYPPYITAGAFILSRNTLFEIFYMSLYTKAFRFDDIYLGILAKRAKIPLLHCEQIHYYKPIYLQPSDYKDVIATHGFGDHEYLLRIWRECKEAGFA